MFWIQSVVGVYFLTAVFISSLSLFLSFSFFLFLCVNVFVDVLWIWNYNFLLFLHLFIHLKIIEYKINFRHLIYSLNFWEVREQERVKENTQFWIFTLLKCYEDANIIYILLVSSSSFSLEFYIPFCVTINLIIKHLSRNVFQMCLHHCCCCCCYFCFAVFLFPIEVNHFFFKKKRRKIYTLAIFSLF